MKTLFIIIMLLNTFVAIAQTKSERKRIVSIEKQIAAKKFVKFEIKKDIGWHGGYEKITVYIKNHTPLLIEKEEKEVRHEYLLTGEERNVITIVTARFYITNWELNTFIRVGKLKHVNKKEKDTEELMQKDYPFDYNKTEIETLIYKKEL